MESGANVIEINIKLHFRQAAATGRAQGSVLGDDALPLGGILAGGANVAAGMQDATNRGNGIAADRSRCEQNRRVVTASLVDAAIANGVLEQVRRMHAK